MADKAEWALRRFCLECQGADALAVTGCADEDCLLFTCRPFQEKAAPAEGSPVRAVRRFCMSCAGGRKDVRNCDAKDCALWSFRFGVRPATFKRVLGRRKKTRGRLSLPGL